MLKPILLLRALSIIFFTGCLPFSGHPQNLPPLAMVIEDSSSTQGYYFLVPYTNNFQNPYDHAQLILDHLGRVVFYRLFDNSLNPTPTIDFKLHPNGRMSYFNIPRETFYIMDSTFTEVDSISCANGYETDQHDLQILPDNHYLLFGKESRYMNLSSYHYFGFNHNIPGSTNAEVLGVVIQEFNENKELVWEWKGHDHYQFGDVDPIWLFNPNKVDWTHANAVERDVDGNILLSLRHFNEITKIDHATGDIIWRMGGKQNQFSFPNDPIRYTGQHDIRRVGDSSVTLFDNGQYTNPPVSRALEYVLDETNKIATLTWEYIYDSAMTSVACGNFQTTGTGNRVIDFGFAGSEFPWMVVVKPDKSEILEIHYPPGYISYRAFNYLTLPWQLNRPEIDCQKIGSDYYLMAEGGHPEYRWSTGETTPSILVTDTGDYFVFVPYGTGYISSEHIYVTDPLNPCLYLDAPVQKAPDKTALSSMPNPATGQVTIVFELPSNSAVDLSIRTLSGLEIRKLAIGQYPAGRQEFATDVSGLTRGIYILSLETDKTRVVRKLVIH